MKRYWLAIPLALAATAPAHATAGMYCSTGGAKPIELSLVISRVVGGPLVSAALRDDGADIPGSMAQWWLDDKEMRLIFIDPNAEVEEAVLMTKRRGDDYVGQVTRRGRSLRVRCEESG